MNLSSAENDPLFIAEAVARKMEAELQRRVEEEELCPECFTPLEAGNIVRECVGYMGLPRRIRSLLRCWSARTAAQGEA